MNMTRLINKAQRTIVIAGFLVANCALNAMPPKAISDSKKNQVEQQQQEEQRVATIRGELVLDSDIITELDWESMQGTLGQLVALQKPRLPDEWPEMALDLRQAWLNEFYQTDDGKRLQKANHQILENRHLQEFRIRDKGKFVIYDVPQGRFEMRVVAQKVVDEKTYVVESYVQFDVGEVDEMDFSKMQLDVLRLLKLGDEAPEIIGTSATGEKLSLSDLRGQYVLMAFGSTANPAFQATTRSLKDASQSTESSDKLVVLTVTVDEDEKAVAEFNDKNGVDWYCLNLGKWDQETLNNYGLKSVPSIWLIDPSGKIVLTGQQFVLELNRTKYPFGKLVDDAIAGRLTIGGEGKGDLTPTRPGQNESKDGQTANQGPGTGNP